MEPRSPSYDPKALGMVSWKTMPGVLHAEFNRMPMEALAQLLADRLGAPVINMTGLEGELAIGPRILKGRRHTAHRKNRWTDRAAIMAQTKIPQATLGCTPINGNPT